MSASVRWSQVVSRNQRRRNKETTAQCEPPAQEEADIGRSKLDKKKKQKMESQEQTPIEARVYHTIQKKRRETIHYLTARCKTTACITGVKRKARGPTLARYTILCGP